MKKPVLAVIALLIAPITAMAPKTIINTASPNGTCSAEVVKGNEQFVWIKHDGKIYGAPIHLDSPVSGVEWGVDGLEIQTTLKSPNITKLCYEDSANSAKN